MKLKRLFLFSFLFLGILAFYYLLRITVSISIPLHNYPSFSQAVYDRSGKLLRLTLSSDEKYRLWQPIEKISPALVRATLMQEDQYFYWHPGINPFSVIKALKKNIASSQKIGASTITMQVARIRFGLFTRSITGKVKQVFYALVLEALYSKKEILEAYLNLAPYGGNVEGVGAAGIVYFNKSVKEISPQEALLLSVVPQDPNGRLPVAGKNQDELWAAVNRLSKKIYNRRIPISFIPLFNRKILPNSAPHYVQRLINENPFESEIVGTIDSNIQKLIEAQVSQYITRNQKIGIKNASVILVHHKTMEVRGYIGSADYFSKDIHGAFDGIKGRRSPGSALKPFIYGLAIDKGIIHPNTLLKDTIYYKTTYNPENFDREFVGPITATDALVHSRNVPAVDLLNQILPKTFYQFLKDSNIGAMRSEDFYGLSLALGGVEVRPDELSSLYAMLANKGVQYPLRFKDKDNKDAYSPQQRLSPEASFLVLDMLRSNPRPSFDLGKANSAAQLPWKTGTSFGFRDAWAAGVVGSYVLIVWIGNFDGKSNPAFVGREAAGPLFFSIADALKSEGAYVDEERRDNLNLKKVTVCALSGELPNPACPHRKESWFIPGKSPIKTCSIHRAVTIDPQSGLRSCKPSPIKKVFEFWPSELLTLFEQTGLKRNTPPLFEKQCNFYEESQLKIISPEAKIIYSIAKDDKIPFRASSDGSSQNIFWFVDNALVGTSRAGEDLFWPGRPGSYEVKALDDFGTVATITLQIEDRASNN